MSVISGIFMFTSRDTVYLGNLIKGIFSNLLKGIWDTFLFTSRDIGYWYPPPIQASLINILSRACVINPSLLFSSRMLNLLQEALLYPDYLSLQK